MLKLTQILVTAAALNVMPMSASAQAVGEWALGNFEMSGYWFVGVVESIDAGGVTLAYHDGDRETLPAKEVKPYNWKVGSEIDCNFENAGEWYAAKITKAKTGSTAISVIYDDDSDTEDTTTALCRSRHTPQ